MRKTPLLFGAPVMLVGGTQPLEHIPDTRFDVVVCGLLNDVPSPSALLERLASITGRWLVLDVAGPDAPSGHGAFAGSRLVRRALRDAAVVAVGGGERTPSHPEARFYPSPSGLRALVLAHGLWFDDVRVQRGVGEGRLLCFARRRRLKRAIVLAGPSSAGKSTLMDRLRSGTAPKDIREHLGLTRPDEWAFGGTGRDEQPPAGTLHAVLHYDLSRAWRRRLPLRWDKPLETLDVAESVTIVTLMADSETLAPRARARAARADRIVRSLERGRTAHALDTLRGISSRLLRPTRRDVSTTRLRALARFTLLPRAMERELALRRRRAEGQRKNLELASDPELLGRLYELWFSECRRWPDAEHLMLDQDLRIVSVNGTPWADPAGAA